MFGKRKRTDAIVVGAGPVGRFLALELNARGIGVHVFEQEWRGISRSYAAALHPSSLELLDRFGLVDRVLEHALRVDRVSFYDSVGPRAIIDMRELPSKYPFVAVIPQNELEAVLEAELKERGIEIEWHSRVAELRPGPERVEATIELIEHYSSGYAVAHTEETVAKRVEYVAAFAIGADGADSFTRLNQGFRQERGPAEEFEVFEFASERSPSPEMRVVIDPSTTNVLWTLPHGRQRWSFQVGAGTPDPDRSRLVVPLRDESTSKSPILNRLIHERAPWFEGPVNQIIWSGEARFERRLASRVGNGRIWLLGDAAHGTSPIGVQSMNAGLLEASELAEIIADIVRRNAPFGRLESYESSVRRRWKQLLGVENPIQAQAGTDEWVRANAARIIPCIPATDTHLQIAAEQLRLWPNPLN
jgi:2-polyprenyl-6-methoxyphenol hydroxylase-like FAD-dependent oxidoreductase